jgi:hypothetical protein
LARWQRQPSITVLKECVPRDPLTLQQVPASASRAAAGQPLESLVRLDTCVTVVSAAHLLADMATAAPVAVSLPSLALPVVCRVAAS